MGLLFLRSKVKPEKNKLHEVVGQISDTEVQIILSTPHRITLQVT